MVKQTVETDNFPQMVLSLKEGAEIDFASECDEFGECSDFYSVTVINFASAKLALVNWCGGGQAQCWDLESASDEEIFLSEFRAYLRRFFFGPKVFITDKRG